MTKVQTLLSASFLLGMLFPGTHLVGDPEKTNRLCFMPHSSCCPEGFTQHGRAWAAQSPPALPGTWLDPWGPRRPRLKGHPGEWVCNWDYTEACAVGFVAGHLYCDCSCLPPSHFLRIIQYKFFKPLSICETKIKKLAENISNFLFPSSILFLPSSVPVLMALAGMAFSTYFDAWLVVCIVMTCKRHTSFLLGNLSFATNFCKSFLSALQGIGVDRTSVDLRQNSVLVRLWLLSFLLSDRCRCFCLVISTFFLFSLFF